MQNIKCRKLDFERMGASAMCGSIRLVKALWTNRVSSMGTSTFGPELEEKIKNVSKSAKIRFHPLSIAYLSFSGPNRRPRWPYKGNRKGIKRAPKKIKNGSGKWTNHNDSVYLLVVFWRPLDAQMLTCLRTHKIHPKIQDFEFPKWRRVQLLGPQKSEIMDPKVIKNKVLGLLKWP